MKISIIGASGIVGSCTAFVIAERGLADELVMLGRRLNIVTSHAVDIQAALSGRRNIIVRSSGYEGMADSDIIIITAGVHFPAGTPVGEKLAPNIPIIRDIASCIKRYCPGAVVITATNPVDVMNYAIYLSASLDRRQLIGCNLNDTTRFRMLLAKELGIAATRVEGLVLGEHPGNPLLIFSSVKVDEQPIVVADVVQQKVRDEIKSYLSAFESLKADRSAGWTTAAGIAALVEAIVKDTGAVLPCSAITEGEYGYRGLSIGLPAVIGKSGIRLIQEWELADSERRALDQIARDLGADCSLVSRLLQSS